MPGRGHGSRVSGAALIIVLGALLGGTVALSVSSLADVAELFRTRSYAEARNLLLNVDRDVERGDLVFWHAHLARSPEESRSWLERGLATSDLPEEVRMNLGLEAASLELARGQFRRALNVLLPLLEEAPATIPGEAFLLTGLGMRALGQFQRAREMLASIRQDDPHFQLARCYLGEISLEMGDPVLALRYFDSAAATGGGPEDPPSRVLAGRWRALRASGQPELAAALLAELERASPGSLALLEIRYQLRQERDEEAAMLPPSEEPTEAAVSPLSGRYCLQLGAFSDRALALDFLRRYEDVCPELRIDEVQDERGQFLYKVRTGNFVSPGQARSAARELSGRLGIEVFMADLTD